MITLTTPITITGTLGGNTNVIYNRAVVTKITYDVIAQTLTATVRLTASATASAKAILGQVTAIVPTSRIQFDMDKIALAPRDNGLTAGEATSVATLITNAQNAVENGLISLTLAAGVQANGT